MTWKKLKIEFGSLSLSSTDLEESVWKLFFMVAFSH
jgi:hypothetical protein